MDTPEVQPERDNGPEDGGDDLPTYDDLAAQHGPNSRFGRWRGWIEKRAAERYTDITPAERRRRRERGWDMDSIDAPSPGDVPIIVNQPATPMPNGLQIRTEDLDNYYAPPPDTPLQPSPLPSLTSITHRLRPSHLKITHFGSRFLPHSTSPIRCLLPLLGGKLLLIGHDEGLSVLDTYPQEWSETDAGIKLQGPEEAVSRPIWFGESVYQMSLLEVEESGEGSPQGVVLLLVGPETDSPLSKEESLRTLRMYNLASLTSLAKWTIAHKGTRPLDLTSRPSNHVHQLSPLKKRGHRHQSSFARSIKSWIDQPTNTHHGPGNSAPSSYNHLLSPASVSSSSLGRPGSRPGSRSPSPNRQNSDDSTASWDFIDDLPSRWALDFVPLASPGSRLASSNVLSYTLWNNGDPHQPRSGRLLAVATKSNILLYETPKGERAFRFVKEFYTPMQPRSITFFQQVVVDVARSPSDAGPARFNHSHRRSPSTGTMRGERVLTSPSGALSYGTQLSLFVIFDKKAGWIRLADSAVGEFELYDEGTGLRDASSPLSVRKSRISFDASSLLGKWIPLTQCEVPIIPSATYPPPTKKVHVLTRGRKTHILPCPLPTGAGACRPLRAIMWKSAPTSVRTRVCSNEIGDGPSPYLQLVGYGEHGIEVHELSLNFMGKGKGKERADDSVWTEDDAGGATGFLCMGGHWDQPHYSPYHPLNRTYSNASNMSSQSYDSVETEELVTKMEQEQGMYAWCRKGLEDWHIFWVGGSTTEEDEAEEDL
ncbi:hypothetical protein BDZ89DRAFT_1102201 [Hymenopellis radicata]|nr:hypothetical protein BDZ89DRAFT_1102201 [Hymenopellis radicata]